MNARRLTVLVLAAACSDPGEAIPPALIELHPRAAGDDASAPLDLGLRYVTGTGIPPDERAALLRWIGQAAAQGHAVARFEWGSDYTLEPHRDFGRAADRLRRSAVQSFAPARVT